MNDLIFAEGTTLQEAYDLGYTAGEEKAEESSDEIRQEIQEGAFLYEVPKNTPVFLKISSAANCKGITLQEQILRILDQWTE